MKEEKRTRKERRWEEIDRAQQERRLVYIQRISEKIA